MTYTSTSIFALGVALAIAASPALAQTSTSPTPRGPSATSQPSRAAMPSDIQSMKVGDLVGKSVYDDKGERIGEVDDVVVNKSTKQTAAVIGVGGFLGIGERKAAVPVSELKVQGDKIVGSGLTKDAVKSMAEYKDSDKDQWEKVDRNRMLSDASPGTGISPSGSTSAPSGATSPSGSSRSPTNSSPSGSSSMGSSGSSSANPAATSNPPDNSTATQKK
jgi:sporulation protein YlmC with PRC-barrel domain